MSQEPAIAEATVNEHLLGRTVLRRSHVASVVGKDAPGLRVALTGDVAIARGVLEGGAKVIASFPGAPACQYPDVLAALAEPFDLHVEWSINEKTAFEVAAAAAVSGVRACYGGKDLGMNVAADTIMQLAYGGVDAGMVMIAATDVGAYVSSGEFDCRYYSTMFGLPGMDPADPQEAKDMTAEGFALSERVRLPILLLVTNEVGWRYSPVELGGLPPATARAGRATRDAARWKVHGPMVHRNKRWQRERLEEARELAEASRFNRLAMRGDEKVGVITIGAASNQVWEVKERFGLDDVAVLKLGFFHPLPDRLIAKFLAGLKRVLVVEALEPYVEDKVRELLSREGKHVEVFGKRTGHLPTEGALTFERVAGAMGALGVATALVPPGDPELRAEILAAVPETRNPCPGCPHRATFFALKQALKETGKQSFVLVDTGCASFAGTPMGVGDMKLNLGSSLGLAGGMRAAGVVDRETIAAIGDSAFLHGGIPPLLNMAQEGTDAVVLVMDNDCNAATGHQPTASGGIRAAGDETKRADFAAIARACKADYVATTDPYELGDAQRKLVEALSIASGQRVVVASRECAYLAVTRRRVEGVEPPRVRVTDDCSGSKTCVSEFGCPAIYMNEDGKATIDQTLCFRCGVCLGVCSSFAWVME